ncbi:MAG: CDC48 family AAA ATPase [Candidatus Parvarchaeota archaeon]|nr:CDC48 family AAA ATPase [Candidatus Parvarchaeota archaeon]
METNEDVGIELKVAEAHQDDIGYNLVRVDNGVLKQIGVRPGEFIEIEGNRKTVALVDRAYPADLNLRIIRMDGTTRKNAKATIGENVVIRPAEVTEADEITLAPTSNNVKVNSALLSKLLNERAMTKGDLVRVGNSVRGGNIGDIFGDEFIKIMLDGFSGAPIFGLGEMMFIVLNTSPKGYVMVTETTRINLSHEPVKSVEERARTVSYEDIGGISDAVGKIREMVELPLKHPEIFIRLGVNPPKGVLLYGPPGTGKTLLARAVADESNAHFISINGPEVMSKWVGDAEKRLRDLFDEAEKNAPSIIFIDEIDAIATKREESVGEVEHRVVSQLLTLMDGLKGRGKVIVIAATNRPNAIDPALRRPGRFDREIQIGVPDQKGRLEILKIHTRRMPLDNSNKKVDLEYLSKITHGFVGADIEALVKEAAMNVIRRNISELNIKESENIPKKVLDNLVVTQDDFIEALRFVRPSAMREVLVEKPNVKWEDVGGLENVKRQLIEAIEWPIKYPDAFKRIGIAPPKGILLYGPPGTGKTLLAKAIATESEANFIAIKGPEIFNKYVGESEKNVREIFNKARQVAPSIVLIDEIDAITTRRSGYEGNPAAETVVNQLLTELDGLQNLKGVVVIGATNRIDKIDAAILRPGRFDSIIFVPPPNREEQSKILDVYLKKMPLEEDEKELREYLLDKIEGFVGADIERLTKEAGMAALREDINNSKVSRRHFDKALQIVRPSLTPDEVKMYNEEAAKLYENKKLSAVEKLNYFG